MEKGQKVEIFEDTAKTKKEGDATLITKMADSSDGKEQLWQVLFDGDSPRLKVWRWVEVVK